MEHAVVPDRIEAATYLAAVGIAGGEINLVGARPDHMDMLCQKVGRWECEYRLTPMDCGLWLIKH
ncbi:MAG: hypothetical protein Ct9H90mP5_04560 [Acidimicrobiaceae bacterium]|nr:MAG: hypothetical protein Ct9H90mP5_04560 [Acidimicrobiaceae bacterium]